MQIQLDDLGAGPLAGVAYGQREVAGTVRGDLGLRGAHVLPGERRVRAAVPERVQRRRVQAAHLAGQAQRGLEIRPGLTAGLPRHAHRKPPGGVHPPGQHPGHRRAALLAGEEGLHDRAEPAVPAAQRVRPAGQQHEDHRHAGRHQGVQQLRLRPRQPQVRHIAALAGGAPAEQARPVAEHSHAHIRLRDPGHRLPDTGRVGVGDRAALGERDLGVRQVRAQRVQKGGDLDAERDIGVPREDVGGEGVAAEHRERVRRARAHDRDPGVRGQRQHAAGVVQQHHRLLRQTAGQGAVLRRVQVDRPRRLRPPVRVQQAQLALLQQDAPGRPVHQGLGDTPLAYGRDQRGAVALQGRQLHVDARDQRQPRRLRLVRRDPVQRPQETDAEVVGDHRAGEPPLLAQQLGQQVRVGRGGHAIGLGVRRHHRAGPALAQRHLERRQRDVRELPDPRTDRGQVPGAGRGRVPGEVLERGDHPRRLQAAHIGRADGADQVRVLADRLLHPPPARVAHHVQDGGQALVGADRAQVPADAPAHLLDQRRVEGRAPGERHRVRRGPPGGEPGQALLMGHGRDAEAARRDDPALRPGQGLRAEPRFHGGGAEGAGQLAEAEGDQLVPVVAGGHLLLQRGDPVAVRGRAHPHAVQLGGLLPQGHPGEQVRHAGVGGQGGVAPRSGGHGTPVTLAVAHGVYRPPGRMFRIEHRMFREPMAREGLRQEAWRGYDRGHEAFEARRDADGDPRRDRP